MSFLIFLRLIVHPPILIYNLHMAALNLSFSRHTLNGLIFDNSPYKALSFIYIYDIYYIQNITQIPQFYI